MKVLQAAPAAYPYRWASRDEAATARSMGFASLLCSLSRLAGCAMNRLELQIFTDYHQFSLCDPEYKSDVEEFTEEALARRMLAGRNEILVLTVRNLFATVVIETCDRDAVFVAEDWDHVAECSFEVESGRLEVVGCTDGPVASLTVEPGVYRVRGLFGHLDAIADDGLDGN